MRQITKVKNAVDLHVQRTINSFKEVYGELRALTSRIDTWAVKHCDLSTDFYELREELATNGVIRDIRALQREFEEFRQFRYQLEHNGVAEAINGLHREVFHDSKDAVETGWNRGLLAALSGGEYTPEQEPTLAGKVDAIIEHLGLDVSVKPEEVKEAKVVAKKVSTKKKGRR